MAEKNKTQKVPVRFTPELQERYLKVLREVGFKTLAAEQVNVTPGTVSDHCNRDPAFASRVADAVAAHTEDVIVREMFRRGVQGVEKPIIGGKHRDEIVAHETVYSDAVLLALYRSRAPEAKEASTDAGGGRAGGVMLVPAAPMTMDDWQKQFGEAAKGRTGRPADAS